MSSVGAVANHLAASKRRRLRASTPTPGLDDDDDLPLASLYSAEKHDATASTFFPRVKMPGETMFQHCLANLLGSFGYMQGPDSEHTNVELKTHNPRYMHLTRQMQEVSDPLFRWLNRNKGILPAAPSDISIDRMFVAQDFGLKSEGILNLYDFTVERILGAYAERGLDPMFYMYRHTVRPHLLCVIDTIDASPEAGNREPRLIYLSCRAVDVVFSRDRNVRKNLLGLVKEIYRLATM